MPDQNNTEGQQEPPSKKLDVVKQQEPNAKSQAHGSKEISKKWHTVFTKSVLDDAWGKVIAESILATVAVTVAYIYWSQLQTMSGQLQEMQSSATQTNLLIVNAAHQARETQDLAVSAGKQAEAAKRAADTAAAQLEQSERPWLKVEMVAVTGFEFTKDGGASITVQPHIHNIGNSVATNVIFTSQLRRSREVTHLC